MHAMSLAALGASAVLAGAVQGATGFGFAALAVPAFLLIMDSLAAVQVTAVVSLAMSLMLAPRLWRAAPPHLLLPLIAGSVAGFPLGLAAFLLADVRLAKLAIGLLTAIFVAALTVREWRRRSLPEAGGALAAGAPWVLFVVGVASGLTGAALAAPGPLVVLYLLGRGIPMQTSRALTLTLFAFSYAAVTVLHAFWGGMTAESWILAAWLAPLALIGAAGGHLAAALLSERQFRMLALAVLTVAAAMAIASGL